MAKKWWDILFHSSRVERMKLCSYLAQNKIFEIRVCDYGPGTTYSFYFDSELVCLFNE